MSELPMVRNDRPVRDWVAIRGEIATYTTAAILIACLVSGYKAFEFFAGLVNWQQKVSQELSIAINRLSLIEEEELLRLERLRIQDSQAAQVTQDAK